MDTNLKPQISILIPTHGNGEFFEDCLKSITGQKFTNFEVILVDDGCEFNIENTAKAFLKNIKFEIVKSRGKGVSDALNTGLDHCHGEYVARMDSDDLMVPDRLSIQISILKNNPEIVLLGSNIDFIDKKGLKLTSDKYPENHDEIIMEFTRRNPFAHPSVIFNAKIVRELGGYRKFFEPAEDLDLWLRISKYGKLRNVQQSLIQYRIHENQVTKKTTHLSNRAVHAAITNFRLINAGEDQLPDLYETVEDWHTAKFIQTPENNLEIPRKVHPSPTIDKIYRFSRNPIWGTQRLLVKTKLFFPKSKLNDKIQSQLKKHKKLNTPMYMFWITCAFIVNPIQLVKIVIAKSKKQIVKILRMIRNLFSYKKFRGN